MVFKRNAYPGKVESLQIGKPLEVPDRAALTLIVQDMGPFQLGQTDRGVDVRHVVLVAGSDHVVLPG